MSEHRRRDTEMTDAIDVRQRIDRPVDEVWALVSDFGNVSWMPAGTECRLEGQGPGMIRHVTTTLAPTSARP